MSYSRIQTQQGCSRRCGICMGIMFWSAFQMPFSAPRKRTCLGFITFAGPRKGRYLRVIFSFVCEVSSRLPISRGWGDWAECKGQDEDLKAKLVRICTLRRCEFFYSLFSCVQGSDEVFMPYDGILWGCGSLPCAFFAFSIQSIISFPEFVASLISEKDYLILPFKMNQSYCSRYLRQATISPASLHSFRDQRFLPTSTPTFSYHSRSSKKQSDQTQNHYKKTKSLAGSSPTSLPSALSGSLLRLPFWSCRSTWKRARINTLRCLVGCTAGDFSAMWTLQTYYPGLGMNAIMLASSTQTFVFLLQRVVY